MSSISSIASIHSPISADDLINGARGVPAEKMDVTPAAELPHSTVEAVVALSNAQKGEGVAEVSWFGKVKQHASAIADFFKNVFSRLGQMIVNAWTKVKDFFSGAAVPAAPAAIERVADLANGITSKLSANASRGVDKASNAAEALATAADDATSGEEHGSARTGARKLGLDTPPHGLTQEDLDELEKMSLDEAEEWVQEKTGRPIMDHLSDMEFDFNSDDIMGSNTSRDSDIASPVALSLTPPPLAREGTDGETSASGLKIRVIGGAEGAGDDTSTRRLSDAIPSAQSGADLDDAA